MLCHRYEVRILPPRTLPQEAFESHAAGMMFGLGLPEASTGGVLIPFRGYQALIHDAPQSPLTGGV